MGWSHTEIKFPEYSTSFTDSLKKNNECFIRKNHKCEKIIGASKSCFIACPSDGDLEVMLNLIILNLEKNDIDPYIAFKERAYGQDIFCTKICGKIIESRFCIVILDDAVTKEEECPNIPNPNVYYEYGLMTSLKKHIIPLQKNDLELAFDIQSYDTIKYKNSDLASSLEIAIKDAIKNTESNNVLERNQFISERTIIQKLELAGFKLERNNSFFEETIGDTVFKGFIHRDNEFYLYLGKIDEENEINTNLGDLNIILHRTEEICSNLEENLKNIKKKHKEPKENIGYLKDPLIGDYSEKIVNLQKQLEVLSKVVIGFITSINIDNVDLYNKIESIVNKYQKHERYEIAMNENEELIIEDNIIKFNSQF